MERGFKTFAEDLAVQVRREMGIPAHFRLCSFELTEYLGIPTLGFSLLVPHARTYGLTLEQLGSLEQEVHGICISLGPARAILYNDKNPPTRQQSDVAHEVSHVLLGHPLADVTTGAVSERTKEFEDEAAYLGGALLLPRAAALHVLTQNLSTEQAAAEYGISKDMVEYRCNVSGARHIYRRRGGAR